MKEFELNNSDVTVHPLDALLMRIRAWHDDRRATISSHRLFFTSVCFFSSLYMSVCCLVSLALMSLFFILLLWPRKGSLMKTQTRILDNRLYYTRKIELHRKGKKSRTVRITSIVICSSSSKISVLITVRRVHYSKMSKVPTTLIHCLPLSSPVFRNYSH